MRTALAMLALFCGRVVSTEQFIDELWADRQLSNAKNALQANLTRLRRFLGSIAGPDGANLIRTSANGYVLDLPSASIDARQFEEIATRGSALLPHSPAKAVAAFEEALRMWRGAALLDINGGFRCRSEATRLTERRLDVRKQLITARLESGVDHSVVSELKQLVAEHPGDERLSELLMLALYRGGRQSEALAVFQNARSWLATELGLEPGPGLRQLQQAILVQDRALGALPLLLPAGVSSGS